MSRFLLAGGAAAVLMGAGAIVPVVFDWLERDRFTALGIGCLAAGSLLIAGGTMAAVAGGRKGLHEIPSGIRAALMANALVLAFLALELSDRSIRQDGALFYWTTFLLPPALLLFGGLLAGRRWAWWAARGVAVFGAVWFLGFLILLPFVPLQADGIPTPWYGRLYMAGVTVAFAGVFVAAFRALGRDESRRYFNSDRGSCQLHAVEA